MDRETRTEPRWRGLNHLALVTADMDETVRFYHGVLGMKIVATIRVGDMRHYFFEIGPGSTLAFFEWQGRDVSAPAKPAGVPPDFPTHFDHVSFSVADREALESLRDNLRAAGVEVTEVVDHGFVQSIYFTDPNGISLEASYWVIDPTGRPADYGDRRLFSDDRPVPALEEITESGTVRRTPKTALVGETLDPA